MEEAQHVHDVSIDDVEHSIGKSPQHGAAYVAVDSLIERGIGLPPIGR
jgi:hypothetical protein